MTGGKGRRGQVKRANYLLYHRRDYPPAVVEAKEIGLPGMDKKLFKVSYLERYLGWPRCC